MYDMINCMINFSFLEHLFSATPLIVLEQPFKVVLHKTVLKNLTKVTAKYLYRTDPLFSQSCKLYACNLIKKDSDNDTF